MGVRSLDRVVEGAFNLLEWMAGRYVIVCLPICDSGTSAKSLDMTTTETQAIAIKEKLPSSSVKFDINKPFTM